MAQLGKGKLNYRCPSCFMRDLDIDMFYNKDTKIYSCIRCQYRGTEEDVLAKMRWFDSVMGQCIRDSTSLISTKKNVRQLPHVFNIRV